jgi:hypothetical protein
MYYAINKSEHPAGIFKIFLLYRRYVPPDLLEHLEDDTAQMTS